MKGGRVKGQSTHWFLEEEDGQSADQWHVTQQRLHHHSQRPMKLDTGDKASQTLNDDVPSCPEICLTFSDPSATVGAELHPSTRQETGQHIQTAAEPSILMSKTKVCTGNINDHWNVKRSREVSFDKTEQLDQFKNSSPETPEETRNGWKQHAAQVRLQKKTCCPGPLEVLGI